MYIFILIKTMWINNKPEAIFCYSKSNSRELEDDDFLEFSKKLVDFGIDAKSEYTDNIIRDPKPNEKTYLKSIWCKIDSKWDRIISNISTKNKISTSYSCCTWLIAFGVNKDGDRVSFLSHQIPYACSNPNEYFWNTKFWKALDKTLLELKKISIPESINIWIVWWNNSSFASDEVKYTKIIKRLSKFCDNTIWVKPIIYGSNLNAKATNIYINNQKQQIYIHREMWKDDPNKEAIFDFDHDDIICKNPGLNIQGIIKDLYKTLWWWR